MYMWVEPSGSRWMLTVVCGPSSSQRSCSPGNRCASAAVHGFGTRVTAVKANTPTATPPTATLTRGGDRHGERHQARHEQQRGEHDEGAARAEPGDQEEPSAIEPAMPAATLQA